MSDLKSAILDAKYVDMIELADFVVRDCGLPDMDENGEMLPQQNEIAAAVFRWAAGAQLGRPRPGAPRVTTHGSHGPVDDDDEYGVPPGDAAGAEARETAVRPAHSSEDAQ